MATTCHVLCRLPVALAIAIAGVALMTDDSRAVNIVLSFDASGSEFPAFDPDGARLQSLFAGAETLWEGIIEDDGPVVITCRYRDISSLADGAALLVVGGKPVTGAINIDNDPREWYFDPTPLDHSEYEMVQRTFDSLSPAQQSAWFDGSPPAAFEASYRGTATTAAPEAAQHGLDMFSTVLHEIGHVLGLSSMSMAYPETIGQADFDFDVAPVFVNGAAMAMRTHGTNPNDVDDWTHIAAQSLMCDGCAAIGQRRLPAASDVLAIASAAGWSHVDLPRKVFLGEGLWSENSQWLGNRVPDVDDEVWLRADSRVTLAQDTAADSLFLRDNSSLDLASDSLSLNRLDVDAMAGPSPVMWVRAGGGLIAGSARIGGGSLVLAGGGAEFLTADLGGEIQLLGPAAELRLGGGSDSVSYLRSPAEFSGDGVVVLQVDATAILETGISLPVSLVSSGRLQVDASFGAITLGDFTQDAAGRLEIDVGGGLQSDQFDYVYVAGTADLSGVLDVSLPAGAPSVGSQFTVLRAEQLTDRGLTIGGPDADLFSLVVDELENTVSVYYRGPGLAGDYNRDGVVDAADYTGWRDLLGQVGPGLAADGNGDSSVDELDYQVWRDQFGKTATARLDQYLVSEPATIRGWLIVALAASAVDFRSPRRRRRV